MHFIVLSEILARIEIRVQSLMQNSLIAVRVSLLLSKIAMKATHLVPRITEVLNSKFSRNLFFHIVMFMLPADFTFAKVVLEYFFQEFFISIGM